MNILFVLPNDFLGGAEQLLKMVGTSFNKDSVSIVFLSPKRNTGWEDLSYSTQTYCNYSTKLGSLLFLYNTLRKNRVQNYDLVFTSHVYVNSLIGIYRALGVLKTKKFIARESSSIFHRFDGLRLWSYKLAYCIGYRKMDLLICQTEFMKKQLVEALPHLNKRIKIKVVQNPIDLEHIHIKSAQDMEQPIDGKYMVSAGRLIKEKGFDILIRAFAEAKMDQEMRLLILGEGHERPKLEDLVQSLGISDRVVLAGQVANVYPYFNNAVMCVVSSRIEGFPNVLLQMMSQNNKVVATLCAGGIDEIPGITTCNPDDLEALTKALIAGLGDPQNHRDEFDRYLRTRSVQAYMDKVFASIAV